MLRIMKDEVEISYRTCLSVACVLAFCKSYVEQSFPIGLIQISLRHRKQEISKDEPRKI